MNDMPQAVVRKRCRSRIRGNSPMMPRPALMLHTWTEPAASAACNSSETSSSVAEMRTTLSSAFSSERARHLPVVMRTRRGRIQACASWIAVQVTSTASGLRVPHPRHEARIVMAIERPAIIITGNEPWFEP
jgi:hypothetical protein